MKQDMYKPEFVPTAALPIVFGLSENYFLQRKADGTLKEKVHYFYPAEKKADSKSNKRAMVWAVDAMRNFVMGNEIDQELQELLNR